MNLDYNVFVVGTSSGIIPLSNCPATLINASPHWFYLIYTKLQSRKNSPVMTVTMRGVILQDSSFSWLEYLDIHKIKMPGGLKHS